MLDSIQFEIIIYAKYNWSVINLIFKPVINLLKNTKFISYIQTNVSANFPAKFTVIQLCQT